MKVLSTEELIPKSSTNSMTYSVGDYEIDFYQYDTERFNVYDKHNSNVASATDHLLKLYI